MIVKTGIGYDSHRFAKDRKLILGGIEVVHDCGLLGHSDADVLLHAIMDALLGALALGDIGEHFPDTNPEYRGVSSKTLFQHVRALVSQKGFVISNIDTVIIAEQPKLGEYKQLIAKSIAQLAGISPDCVGIKAKTNEGLDAVGRNEAIACFSVVTLVKED